MVADQPLDALTLASAVGHPVPDVQAALAALAAEYTEQGRGFELRNVAGGWRFYSREEYAAVVEGFVLDGQQARLTNAALETLAVVAYKQPISRARVSAIRGVNVDGVMRTLLTRGLVEEAGQDHETTAPTSTGPRATSWSGSASPRSTTCPSWRRTCPTWTTWRTSWSGWPAPRRRPPRRTSRSGRTAPE